MVDWSSFHHQFTRTRHERTPTSFCWKRDRLADRDCYGVRKADLSWLLDTVKENKMAMKVRDMSVTDWAILIGSWIVVFGLIAMVIGMAMVKKVGYSAL